MSDHTPEPCTCGPLPEPIDDNCPVHGERRVEACLAACAGIPTEQLGDVKALRDRLAESQRILASYCRSLKDKGNDTQAEAVKRHLDRNKDALAPFRNEVVKAAPGPFPED